MIDTGELLPKHRLHHTLCCDWHSHFSLHCRGRHLLSGPGEKVSQWKCIFIYIYIYISRYIQIYPDLCVLDKQHKMSVHQVWLSLTQVFKRNRQSLTDFSCCCHRPETQRLLWLLSLRHQQYHRKLCCSPATRLFCPICLNTGNILISCHATFVTQTLSSFPLLTFDSSFVFPSFLFVFLQADVIYKMSMADRWVWHFL